MNEWDSLSDQEQDFINYLRTKRGPCPDDETLVAFYESALPPDREQETEAHVHLCGICQLAIHRLERFEECQAGELPEPPDWPEVDERARARFSAFLRQQEAPLEARKSFWPKLKVVLLHPALAYLLLAALAYPAYRGLFRKPEIVKELVREKEIVEKPGFDIAAFSTFKLKTPERVAREGQTVVSLSKDEKFFLLSFVVPISERPEFIYNVEIRDREGRVVAAQKAARARDDLGNFLLICRRELFSPGQYELVVKEVNTTTEAVRSEYRFSFAVSMH